MLQNRCHRIMFWGSLIVLALLTACTAEDDPWGGSEKEFETVNAQYTFSLPRHIVGTGQTKNVTRMTPEVVQEEENAESFRGIEDIRLLCFDRYPTKDARKIGSIIELNTANGKELATTPETDYSMTQEVIIPVGTSHFAFYARAVDAPQTHEERMHYGVTETIGLDKDSYTDNSSIRIRPVPICTSTATLGGSQPGNALLDMLNDLANTTSPGTASNNKWATTNSIYLNEAYSALTSMRTLSSFNVQYLLGSIYQMVSLEKDNDQGAQLAAAIKQKIASYCTTTPSPDNGALTLKEQYQGFPSDIHLPAGAARVEWNQEKGKFVIPDAQAYGKGFNIMSMNDYTYPMNLQYQVFSSILAADSLVLSKINEGTWQEMLDYGYLHASPTVKNTTQSVAMVQQVQYAVGRLALRTRIETGSIYDAKGRLVNVSKGFTLKGYIVGGQHEADYDYRPLENSHEYAIYDTDLGGSNQHVQRRLWTDFDYILGLGTAADKDIYLALELENDGEDFYGADGLIAHGATFYLVAAMVPSEGTNYAFGSMDQIFSKDCSTKVNLTILGGWPDKDGDGVPDPDLDEQGHPKPLTGLATATYGLPDMQVPHPMVGVSVDLRWEEGLYFDEVEL